MEPSEKPSTSETSQKIDYSNWCTKQQAADAIGVSTKTVEQLAQDGQIQQAVWRPGGRGARRAVYHPDDVARIAKARRPGVVPFVLPAEQTRNGHGSDSTALAAPAGSSEDLRQAPPAWLLEIGALMRRVASENSAASQSSEKSQKLVLTLSEAAAVSGWSQAYLRRQIEAGTLKAEKDRGWKIRRRDLEAL